MNTRPMILAFLVCGLSVACKVPNDVRTSGAAAPLKLIVAQPVDSQAVAPVVDTLKQSLGQLAAVTSGQIASSLNISILKSNGEMQSIQPPQTGGFSAKLFGANNPLALRERLDAHLQLLEDALRKGSGGTPVDASVLKGAALDSNKGQSFTVWAASGTANPWGGETGPNTPNFVADASAFESTLLEQGAHRGGTFLVLTDPPGGGAVSSTDADHPPLERTASQAAGGGSTFDNAKTSATRIELSSVSKVAGKPINGSFPAGSNIQQSVSVYTGTGQKNDGLSASTLLHGKPGAVTRIGAPIYFKYRSAKLETLEIDKVKEIASQLKRQSSENARVELLSGADRRGTDVACDRLAQARARAVEAQLLTDGVSVDEIISVGKNLSPDDTPDEKLQEYRTVQVFTVHGSKPDAIVVRNVTGR